MYFPTLNTMRIYQIDDFLIKKLDIWLGTRRKSVKKYLSPLQFSLECDIDEETAISMFVICTEQNIKLLRTRYTIECSDCNRILGSYNSMAEIPDMIFCIESNKNIKVYKEMIVIWFELLEDPTTQPYSKHSGALLQGSGSGKDFSLRPERLERSRDEMVRRLISGFNERVRSS